MLFDIVGWARLYGVEAPPRRRGWTLTGPHGGVSWTGSPAQAGMDLGIPYATLAKIGSPAQAGMDPSAGRS
jgi:hypothetical protein